ncbi:MAG TPA: glycosyltransferase [Ktedonobacterales bacterium]
MRSSQAQHGRQERANWRGVVIEGLTRAVEALFLLTLVVLPLDAYLVLPSGRTLGFLSQALTIEMCALFGLTLALGALLGQPTRLPVRWRELVPLGLALLAALASAVMATSHSVALKGCLKMLTYLGVFMVARALLARPQARYHALLALLAGATLVLIAGFFSVTPAAPDLAGALLNIQRTSANLPGTFIQRASATFRYPNELAAYLLLLIPMLTACAVTTRDIAERVAYLLLTCAGGALLLLTYTRGAQLGVAVALIVLLWTLGGYRLGLGGLALLASAALALAFIPGPISARLISAVTGSDGWQVFRLAAWKWAFSTFLSHPLFGVGIGNISLQPGAPVVSVGQSLHELDAENLFLNVLAEMGVFGLLAILLCLGSATWLAVRGVRGSRSWLDRGWNAGALAALVGVLVYGMADPVLVSGQITELLCALVGLSGIGVTVAQASAVTSTHAQTAQTAPRRVPALTVALASHALDGSDAAEATQAAPQPRIVFLLNSRDLGGAEIHTINLASSLKAEGQATLLIIPPRARVEALLRARDLPYRVAWLGMNAGRWKGFLGTLALADPVSAARSARVIRALAAEAPSVFVCPFPREQALVTLLKRQRALRVVWIIHAPLHYLPHRLIMQPLLARLSRQVNLLVAISHTLEQRLAQARFATARLLVIPNAVATTSGSPTPFAQRPSATIGCAGRLTPNKGVAYLIEAMPEVLARRPETHLLIAGSGAGERELRRRVAQLQLGDHVTFLGHVSDMSAFYRRLTLFVHPTVEQEGLPTVILEAQNAGLPVIASSVEGVTELVEDHVTGLLAWPGDPHDLAERILSLLDDPSLARRLALTGWRRMRAHYTLAHATSRFRRAVAALDADGQRVQPWQTESSKMRVVQRSRFLRDTGILLAGKLLTALATALWTVLAARALPPSSYGDLMLCAGIVEIAAVITDAGLTAAATQELTIASAQRAHRLIGTVVWLKLALGVVAAGAAVGATIALPFAPEARHLMLLLAPGLVFISLTSLSLLFRARGAVGYTLIAALVGAVAGSYGALSVYLSAPSADGFARARLLMLIVSGALTLALLALRYRPYWGFDWAAAKRLMGTSALLGLALALNILYYRIDVPLLALLAGSEAVAIYTSAYRVLDVATLLPVTAATAALPLILAQPTRKHLSAFVSQYLELALVAGLFVGVALTASARPILAALYSDRYDAAYPTMVTLAWVGGLTLITNVFSPLAVALERRRLLLYASGAALIANLALNLALIPLLGALGAALATLVTELVVTAPLAWVGARTVHMRPRPRPLIAALLATVVWLALQVYAGAALGYSWLMALAATGVWLLVFAAIAPAWALDIVRTIRMGSARMRSRTATPTSAHADAEAAGAATGDDGVPALAIGEGRP